MVEWRAKGEAEPPSGNPGGGLVLVRRLVLVPVFRQTVGARIVFATTKTGDVSYLCRFPAHFPPIWVDMRRVAYGGTDVTPASSFPARQELVAWHRRLTCRLLGR